MSELTTFYPPEINGNHTFSNNVRGNRSYSIHSSGLRTEAEFEEDL